MIRSFHEMRRHEEGQALVLAAISMLVLAVCVLATVNITYAAKQRIQLQNAADAAAYTTAAYQARALNLLAYTNRAMVVQYAAQMDLLAIYSYNVFNQIFIQAILKLLSMIPVIGWIFTIISIVYFVITFVLMFAVLVGLPLLDGITYGFSLMQSGIVNGIQPQILSGSAAEVAQYNSAYPPPVMLSRTLLNIDDTRRWGVSGTMVAVDPTLTLTPATENTGQAGYERLVMVEMANAARPAFTANGGGGWTLSLFPRTWNLISCMNNATVCIQKTARTEWGSLMNGGIAGVGGFLNTYLLSGAFTSTEQLYSLDRFTVRLNLLGVHFKINLDAWAYADRSTPLTTLGNALSGIINSIFGINLPSSGLPSSYVKATGGVTGDNFFADLVAAPLNALVQTWLTWVNKQLVNQVLGPILLIMQWLPFFHFGMMPYARFRAAPVTPNGLSTAPGGNELFNQPPVLLMLQAPATMLQAGGGPFLGNFGFKIGQYSSGSTPRDTNLQTGMAATRNTAASKNGYVDTVDFHPGDTSRSDTITAGGSGGFQAVSAAMAYYHRPGDWREPPNLFNPMWGAKLMPLMDYPTIGQSSIMTTLASQQLLVH